MYRGLIACLFTLVLASCASTTNITTRYITDTAVPPAKKVLLVARTPEADVREKWEVTCADVLSNRKLDLVPSHTALPLWYEAGNDRLLAWARDNHADAVIIAEITGLLLAPPQMPAQSYMQSERGVAEDNIGAATWSFFIGRKEKKTPVPPEIHEVEMQMLSADGKVLWNGVAYTHEANDLEAIAKSECKAMKRNLDGLRLLP